jgi:hypothetical protein
MTEKDNPEVQKKRVQQLADEIIPGCTVVFDLDQPPTWLRFRIDAPGLNIILGVSGEYHASEIADWSDEHLRNYLRAIAPSVARS